MGSYTKYLYIAMITSSGTSAPSPISRLSSRHCSSLAAIPATN